MGQAVEPILNAMGIICLRVERSEEVVSTVTAALTMVFQSGHAVAVLLPRSCSAQSNSDGDPGCRTNARWRPAPDKQVRLATGNGELLMNVGALATIAVLNPSNFAIICIDNGHYGETGYQKSHTSLGGGSRKDRCRFGDQKDARDQR